MMLDGLADPEAGGTEHIDTSVRSSQDLTPLARILRRDNDSLPGALYRSDRTALFHGDAAQLLSVLPTSSIDCIVTSPPYFGQRDYGVVGQLGLEDSPLAFIERLVSVFRHAKRVLRQDGSLWVNLGDTYWSGKGKPTSRDNKRRVGRFLRPQDKKGPLPWCRPKQQLLIPHRFAIAMQDDGWLVRNDNVWYKPAPLPDPSSDRCSKVHEYVFHFTLKRRYYFNMDAVAQPSLDGKRSKPPASVWAISTRPSEKQHPAVFPEQLVALPVLATCRPEGIVLDPFCGSGTTVVATLHLGSGRQAIGIDLSEGSLLEAQTAIQHAEQQLTKVLVLEQSQLSLSREPDLRILKHG